uniref:Uncharacterized protein n=1 Tax=Anguilla anguilla TaxID=7936 RepID=A0A0E9Q550_ANGAN
MHLLLGFIVVGYHECLNFFANLSRRYFSLDKVVDRRKSLTYQNHSAMLQTPWKWMKINVKSIQYLT